MNDLEMVTTKISSAREILDSALDSLEHSTREKTETLMFAVDEFLQYYLEDFDRKFQVAWKETVIKLKHEEYDNWKNSDFNVSDSQYTAEELNAMCDNSTEPKGHYYQEILEFMSDTNTTYYTHK